MDDLRTFDALERDVKKGRETIFSKRGKAKAAQELTTLSEDDNA